ncbi:mediator complex subunit Srb8 [Schizosaccharomyces octosporus yFS286]|uniref:Mediator of RNA polymerase II transcription subunit 12 n=1 Tax=Schizosaccharomyces octosporus (strain yFS286) TaxID=483514 RepID=S9PTW9_SCHOY|nr:mediator complex subunit Srb8 [Schizosaccharomyces octosporus yFS286]EPX71417.1 mediator complex subunit Srb8 [Schizosaccharomyces octosporus yFS286]
MSHKEHIGTLDEIKSATTTISELDVHPNAESLLKYLASRDEIQDKRLYDEKTDAQSFSSVEAISKGHAYTTIVDDERGSATLSVKDRLNNSVAIQNLHKYSKALLRSQASIPLNIPYTRWDPPPRVRLSETRKLSWLQDLANDTVSLSELSKKIPHGVWGKEIIQLVHDFRVPLPRAIWFIRCTGINEIRSFFKKYPDSVPKDWILLWTDVVGDSLLNFFTNYIGDNLQSFSSNFIYVNRLFGRLLVENLIIPSFFISKVISLIPSLPTHVYPLIITFLDYFSVTILQDSSSIKTCVTGLLPFLLKLYQSSSVYTDLKKVVLNKAADFLFRLASLNRAGFIFFKEWEVMYPILSIIWKPNKTHDSLLSVLNDLNIRYICLLDASALPIRFLQTLSNFKPSLCSHSFAKTLLYYSFTEVIASCFRWCIYSENQNPEHRLCIFLSVLQFYDVSPNIATNLVLSNMFQITSLASEESFKIAQMLNYLYLNGYFMFSGYVARLAAMGYLRESMLMASSMDVQRQIILHLPLFQISQPVRSKLSYILARGSFVIDYDQCNFYIDQFRKNPEKFAFKKGESFSIINYTLLRTFSVSEDSVYIYYMVLFYMYHYCMLKEFFDCIIYTLNKPRMRYSVLILLAKRFPNMAIDKRTIDRILLIKPESLVEDYLLHEIKHLYQLDLDYSFETPEDESLCIEMQGFEGNQFFYIEVFGENSKPYKALDSLFEAFFKTDDDSSNFALTNSLFIMKKHLILTGNYNRFANHVVDRLIVEEINYSVFIRKILKLYGDNVFTIGELLTIVNRLLETVEKDIKGYIMDTFMCIIFADERDPIVDHWFNCLLLDARKVDVGFQFLLLLIQHCNKNDPNLKYIWNILRCLDFQEIIRLIPEKKLLRKILEKNLSIPFGTIINENFIKEILGLDHWIAQVYAVWLTTLTKEELSNISEDVMENILIFGSFEKGYHTWYVICLGFPNTLQIFQRILLYSINRNLDLPSHFIFFLSTIAEFIVHKEQDEFFMKQFKENLKNLFHTLIEQVLHAEDENDSLIARIKCFSCLIFQFHNYLERDEFVGLLRTLSTKKFVYKNQPLFELMTFIIDNVKSRPIHEDEISASFNSWTNIECGSFVSDLPEALKEFNPRKATLENSIW